MIPQPVVRTLFRALVWSGNGITEDERDDAWAWLEENDPYGDEYA